MQVCNWQLKVTFVERLVAMPAAMSILYECSNNELSSQLAIIAIAIVNQLIFQFLYIHCPS